MEQSIYAEGDDLTVIDLIEAPAAMTPREVDRIRAIALAEPLLVRRLVSPQGHVTAINITVELPGKNQATEVPEVVGKAREIAAHVERTYPDIRVYLSGVVAMNNRLVPVDNSLIFISFVSRLRAKRTDSLTNRFFLLSIRPV